MSDYLSNLSARALNLARVARPRLPSRFEPPTRGLGARGLDSLDAEDEELTPETSLPSSPELLARGLEFLALRDSLDSRAGGRAKATRRPGGDSTSGTFRPDDDDGGGRSAARPGQNISLGRSRLSESTESTRDGDQSRASTPGSKRPTGVNDNLLPEYTAALDAAESRAERSVSRAPLGGEDVRERGMSSSPDHRGAEARPVPSSLEKFVDTAAHFAPPAPVAPRRVTPHVAAPSPPIETKHSETTDSAPRIKITIGRVEVRAVMPAAPPPPARPRPAPASPSLDEYLRKGERNPR